MRILFDGHHVGRQQTGNETYARELLRGLASRASIDLVVALDPGADLAGLDPTQFQRVELPRPALLRLPALGLASRRLRTDLVHSIYYLPPMARRPTLVSIHDVSFERYPQFFSRRELYKNRLAVRWAARHADMVLTLTEHARSEITAEYGLDAARVKVVPAGVGEAFARAGERPMIRTRTGQPLRVLAVGAIQPRKNLSRLMQALRRVATTHAVTLRIIGPDGHAAAGIRAELVDSSVLVEAVGYVTEAALVDEYLAADVFAYPSIYEGFGIPVLEAMACGTPVVTTTGGSLPEVAGGAALLVDPYDVDGLAAAITRVADDEALQVDLSRRGREQAKRYTWPMALDRLIEAYDAVLGSPR